jgi:O-antigen/teichoic acid export membrane protein
MSSVIYRLLRNSSFLLASTLIARGASAILFIVAARQFDQESVGVYSLAITCSIVLLAIASWGLDQILIRDVARTPADAARYLTNFFALRLGLVSLAYGGMWLGLSLLHPYAQRTMQIILIVGLSAVPDSLNDICQAVFIAREQVFYPSMISVGLALVRIGLGTAIMLVQPDLILLAWLFPITSLVSMTAMVSLTLASGLRPVLHFDWVWLKRMFASGVPLAFINSLLVLDVQAGVVLLSLLISETAVALYGAANAIFTGLAILPYVWQLTIFPLMSRLHARSDKEFEWFYEKLYVYLTIGALALILSFTALADLLVIKLYGSTFDQSIDILRVLVITLFFSFLNIPNSRLMLILNRQDKLALFLSISVGINILLAWLLIPHWGIMSVALTRLLSTTLFFLINFYFVSRRVRRVNLLRLIWRPLLAGLGALIIMIIFDQVASLWRMVIILSSYAILLWICKAIPPQDLAIGRLFLKDRIAHSIWPFRGMNDS